MRHKDAPEVEIMGEGSKRGGKTAPMARGSIYTLRGKCGKDNCRCRRGELHETPVLSYSLKGRTHIITLREKNVPRVRQALDRYKRAKDELEAEALAGIEALRRELRGKKAGK